MTTRALPTAPSHHKDDLSPHSLRDTERRWRCPCGALVQRLPTGRMRYHGATAEHPQRCPFPEDEWAQVLQDGGLELLTIRHPHMVPAYVAIAERMAQHKPPKRAHGGQLRRPDAKAPGWRWRH